MVPALIRDERKPVLLGKHPIGKPRLQVYSAAGALLQTIQVGPTRQLDSRCKQLTPAVPQWDSKTRITALGWTSDESLVVLTQDGTYRIYPLSVGPGTPSYSQHHLGPEAQEAGVIEAQVYEEGMVVLLGNLTFVHVTHWRKPQQAEDDGGDADADASLGGKVVQLANTGLSEPPTCWSILPPNLSQSRGLEVLIAAGNAILRLDEIDCVDQVNFRLQSCENLFHTDNACCSGYPEGRSSKSHLLQMVGFWVCCPARPTATAPNYGSLRPTFLVHSRSTI